MSDVVSMKRPACAFAGRIAVFPASEPQRRQSRGVWRCNIAFPMLNKRFFLFSLLLLAGCSRGIDTHYGQRNGSGASASVNGTAVLGEMFEQAGHRVFSWGALSPRLRSRADCIVWFPNDFEPPKKEVRDWLEEWLKDDADRTLIYVGRDFDAAPWCWEHVLGDAPADQQELVRDRLSAAKRRFSFDRQELPKSADCGWFTIDSSPALRQVKTLKGDAAWLDGVDAAKTDIELRSRLSPPKTVDILLQSSDDVLVSREEVDDSQLIVVANGSFLLNLPLVNHEHRKLADKLIDAVGPPAKTVVFLESDHGGPPIRDDDPAPASQTGFEIFSVWPTNWILLHLAAVGVIFCFSRWPIFGRPKTDETASGSDFGRHVDALADLLKRSRDRSYAMERILNYRQRAEQTQ
jgi:hypothetical protein